MSKGRKTVNVDEVISEFNRMLALNTQDKDFRLGVMICAEQVLMKAKRYEGFRYLMEHEVREGEEPGIRDSEIVDETRRHYFIV